MLVMVVNVLLIALPNGMSHQLLFCRVVLLAMHLYKISLIKSSAARTIKCTYPLPHFPFGGELECSGYGHSSQQNKKLHLSQSCFHCGSVVISTACTYVHTYIHWSHDSWTAHASDHCIIVIIWRAREIQKF